MKEFLKSTLVGGVLFLVPLTLLAYLIGRIAQIAAEHVVRPIAAALHVGGWPAAALVVVALVLMCFFTGVFARTHAAKRAVAWVENSRFSKIPQYHQFRSISKRLEHGDDIGRLEPVLVDAGTGWQLGFRIEELEGGFVATYLPAVPEATTGQLAYIEASRLRPLDVASAQMLEVIWRYGIGSAKVIRPADLAPEVKVPLFAG